MKIVLGSNKKKDTERILTSWVITSETEGETVLVVGAADVSLTVCKYKNHLKIG